MKTGLIRCAGAWASAGCGTLDVIYEVLEVAPASIEDIEQLGSKPKFWFYRGTERWLFKEARENTGEDWDWLGFR